MRNCQFTGPGFIFLPWQKCVSIFLLRICPYLTQLMNAPTIHCRWKDEPTRDRTGLSISYAKTKKLGLYVAIIVYPWLLWLLLLFLCLYLIAVCFALRALLKTSLYQRFIEIDHLKVLVMGDAPLVDSLCIIHWCYTNYYLKTGRV